jgi:alkylation response protein AidB-like acyl-CoA dehydrogenase
MLADMAMKLEAARQLSYHAEALSEGAMAGAKVPSLTFVSSDCKTMASDTAMSVTTDAMQLLGGYGYVRDYPVEPSCRQAISLSLRAPPSKMKLRRSSRGPWGETQST